VEKKGKKVCRGTKTKQRWSRWREKNVGREGEGGETWKTGGFRVALTPQTSKGELEYVAARDTLWKTAKGGVEWYWTTKPGGKKRVHPNGVGLRGLGLSS